MNVCEQKAPKGAFAPFVGGFAPWCDWRSLNGFITAFSVKTELRDPHHLGVYRVRTSYHRDVLLSNKMYT